MKNNITKCNKEFLDTNKTNILNIDSMLKGKKKLFKDLTENQKYNLISYYNEKICIKKEKLNNLKEAILRVKNK